MMKKYLSVVIAVCLSGAMISAARAGETVVITPLRNAPTDFIKGADVSTLLEVEKEGAKFYNARHQQQDALAILKENGVNYVRLRLWVNPKDSAGQPYGGGDNDLATTLALAKRAKALGMHVLLDFHYSDFWTDPENSLSLKPGRTLTMPG